MKTNFGNKFKKENEKEENKHHQKEKNKKYSYSTIEEKKDNYYLINGLISGIIKKNKGNKIFLNLMIFIIFFDISKSNITNTNETKYSYITMKIPYGTDYHKVYSDLQGKSGCSFTEPDEVYINGTQVNNQPRQYFKNEENFVELIWKKPITSCHCMFRDCGNILEMDLTYFNTSQVENMIEMFRDCKKLKSLNLSNFHTSKVKNMANMFMECNSLEYIDLSNLDTSQTDNFGHMFYICKSLLSLDLTHFDTSKVSYFDYMFNGCEKLTSINLSNFKTFSAKNMQYMFYGCKELKYLDLSNFDTSNVGLMSSMFNGCESLEYLNISNFQTNSSTTLFQESIHFRNLYNFNLNIRKVQSTG
jgi:surface protein